MATRTASRKKKKTAAPKRRPSRKVHVDEADGVIDMEHSTIGELRERIRTTPYATNKAIMLAALKIKQKNGILPPDHPLMLMFGLNGAKKK